MLRCVVATTAFTVASAGLLQECKQGLQQLSGKSDFELGVQCRAAFAPEVCREARRHLGAQPWNAAKVEESCSLFASSFQGLNVRTLEQAVVAKGPLPRATPVDQSVVKKPSGGDSPSVQTEPKKPGFIGGLLEKVKNREKEEQKPKGPLDFFKQLKDAKEAEKKKKGPLQAFLNQIKDGKKAEEKQNKPGPFAEFFDKLKHEKEVDAHGKPAPGPIADFIKKMKDDKARDEAPKHPLASLLHPAKLYDDSNGEGAGESSSVVGPTLLGGGVVLASVALAFVAGRRSARSARSTANVQEVE